MYNVCNKKHINKKGIYMSYKYLRFKPNTGPFRAGEVNKMKALGVEALKRAFEDSSHPDRSAIYTIVMKKGFDVSALDGYFEGNDNVLGIDDEAFEVFANAPDTRQKDKNGKFIIE